MAYPSPPGKNPNQSFLHKIHLAWIAAVFLALTSTAFATERRYFSDDPGAYTGGGDDGEVASEGIGIGGTGYKPNEKPGTVTGDGNGIGGTGQQAQDTGTGGGIGGTGIIGAITGYGSIFVNGYEVEIPDDMAVGIKDGQTTGDQLRIGQVVEIEATGMDGTNDIDGTHVNAASVDVRHELGGAIERIDQKNRTITILGQKIKLPQKFAKPDASDGSNGLNFEQLNVGDRLDISGFRRDDGTIEATRLDLLPKNEPDHLIATIKKGGASGTTVGGLAIDAEQPLDDAAIEDGSEVRITGYWGGPGRARRFRARRIRARAHWRFSNRVRRIAIEGYVRRARGGGYALGRHRLNRLANGALRQRRIYTGRFDARRRFVLGQARAARLLKRRGRRIRALRRKMREDATPETRRKWLALPPRARKKARKRWLHRNERKRRRLKRRQRRRRNRN